MSMSATPNAAVKPEVGYGIAQRTAALRTAICLAIRHGNSIHDINVRRWADTFLGSSEDPAPVFTIWDEELTRCSRTPQNDFEVEGK